jgi:hypothetical protein
MTDTTTSDHHTVRSFDSDLQEIARKVAAMGALAEEQITDAIRALLDRDTELAEHVIGVDSTINVMQHEIEQKAVETLARRQPVAVDLREIVAAMRLCNDLERIGDHAKHIGRRVIALGGDLYPQVFARGGAHAEKEKTEGAGTGANIPIEILSHICVCSSEALAMAGTAAEPTFMTGSRFKSKAEDEVKQLR